MKILADANIVDVSALYEQHGELTLMSGRDMKAVDVVDVDALIVRSITQVNETLLKDSNVQFVATATSGTDHFDWPYLQRKGIEGVAAPGSNANAVIEYCLASMAELIVRGQLTLTQKTVGIVGFGNVGSRLYRALQNLGIPCKVCDPFLQEEGADFDFVSLDEALNCPIITLHTPLTNQGPHPTYHMLNAKRIQALAPGTLLINAGRGGLVDGDALQARLIQKRDITTIIDCWENEPLIAPQLLALVDIGSPHIAGYSIEAKRSASARNYASFLHHFGLQDPRAGAVDDADVDVIQMGANEKTDAMDLLALILQAVFPVQDIDERLRAADVNRGAEVFDSIRKDISQRREFAHYEVDLGQWSDEQRSGVLLEWLRGLGFKVS
ncbi:MAG: 4-phosphoerythronate dehydrogenase [Gammaproteobacteria bacterium]